MTALFSPNPAGKTLYCSTESGTRGCAVATALRRQPELLQQVLARPDQNVGLAPVPGGVSRAVVPRAFVRDLVAQPVVPRAQSRIRHCIGELSSKQRRHGISVCRVVWAPWLRHTY